MAIELTLQISLVQMTPDRRKVARKVTFAITRSVNYVIHRDVEFQESVWVSPKAPNRVILDVEKGTCLALFSDDFVPITEDFDGYATIYVASQWLLVMPEETADPKA